MTESPFDAASDEMADAPLNPYAQPPTERPDYLVKGDVLICRNDLNISHVCFDTGVDAEVTPVPLLTSAWQLPNGVTNWLRYIRLALGLLIATLAFLVGKELASLVFAVTLLPLGAWILVGPKFKATIGLTNRSFRKRRLHILLAVAIMLIYYWPAGLATKYLVKGPFPPQVSFDATTLFFAVLVLLGFILLDMVTPTILVKRLSEEWFRVEGLSTILLDRLRREQARRELDIETVPFAAWHPTPGGTVIAERYSVNPKDEQSVSPHMTAPTPAPPLSQAHAHPLRRLWKYGARYHSTVVWATIFSILNKLFDLAPPVLIGMAVDIVVQREQSVIAWLGFPNLETQLVILAAATGLIWAFESLFEYLFRVRWRNLAQAVQHSLRMDTYQHVQHLGMSYFEDQSTGRLMAIMNDDINQLERFLDEGANDILQVVTTTIVIGGIFLAIAPSIGWMTILPMPFIAWGSIYFQNKLAPLYARIREQVSVLNSHLSNNLGGIATIKSFTAEPQEFDSIKRESQEYQQRNRKAIRLSSAFVPVIRMIIVTGFVAILFFGGRMTLAGDLEVWQYSVMIFMTQRLLWPLTKLGSTFDLYQRAIASIDRVFDLLSTPQEITSGSTPLALDKSTGDVTLSNVDFAYQGDGAQAQSVIRNLSVDISASQTTAIVGATGSGKSTLVKLLLRFYDVQRGRISIDGVDIRDIRLDDLRQSIGLVSQDVFLFHGTVRENIAYGATGATQTDIEAAAIAAEAHQFIIELPNGYATIVGERGQKLSGGQRQRLSIARAVLKDPPILVLDEATSAVDNETEAAIQRSLERIAVGRTTIVIAHRLSTVRNAHRIFVLDKGRLAERGTHDDLLLQDGIYARLWRVQTGQRTSEIA